MVTSHAVSAKQLLFRLRLIFLLWFLPGCLGWNVNHNNNNDNFQQPSRRKLLAKVTSGAIGGGIVGLYPVKAGWAVTTTPAETIRRSASNIPGYGQSDVFYPRSLLGNWKATREILSAGGSNSLILEYPVRFIKSVEGENAVVADRGYNQANLEQAIRKLKLGTDNSDTTNFVRSSDWTETNPNDLRLVFADGTRKEIKTTKRATERTDDSVFSSEFQRVTQEDSRGIPVITARRVVTKWKVSDSAADALEVVYDQGGGGDPMSMAMGSGSTEQNKILSKSRLHLERE